MTNLDVEDIIQKESNRIIVRLLEINKNNTIVNKYMHELVFDMITKKYKRLYHDILYWTVKKIPYPLTVTADPIFHFETHEEFMAKKRKTKQISFYDK